MSNHFILTVLCISSVLSSITIRRTGWLDRVVKYYKNTFYDDLKKAPLIKIKGLIKVKEYRVKRARIERPPPGYIDSSAWDYKSVLRLLTLIRKSEDAVGVRRAIKRTIKGGRRFMSLPESLKHFPSLAKNHANDFYYAIDSGEYYADVSDDNDKPLEDDDVIVVTNPVEARLPSARISVHLLKSILENRAEAGRFMTTTVKIFSWLPIIISRDNFTQGLSSATNTEATGAAGGGNSTGENATTIAAG